MKAAKYWIVICIFLSPFLKGQGPVHKHEPLGDAEGLCKQNIRDNHGTITITCSGFSKEQADEILKLLHGISKSQNKERDQILQKLDQVLEEFRKNHEQRIITDEQLQGMRNDHNNGGGEYVIITAPSGDKEASTLALQMRHILSSFGFNVRDIDYHSSFPPITDKDIVVVTNQANQAGAQFIYGIMERTTLKTKLMDWNNPDRSAGVHGRDPLQWDNSFPLRVFIYPIK